MRNTGLAALAFGVGFWALVLTFGTLAQTQPPQVIKGPAHPTASVAGADTFRDIARRVTASGGGTGLRRRPSKSHRRI